MNVHFSQEQDYVRACLRIKYFVVCILEEMIQYHLIKHLPEYTRAVSKNLILLSHRYR